jgi:hypothetical protein
MHVYMYPFICFVNIKAHWEKIVFIRNEDVNSFTCFLLSVTHDWSQCCDQSCVTDGRKHVMNWEHCDQSCVINGRKHVMNWEQFSTVGNTRLITMLSIHHMFSTVGNTRLITMLSIHHSNSSVTRLLNIYIYVISDILNKFLSAPGQYNYYYHY